MNNKKTISLASLSLLVFASVAGANAASSLAGKILLQVEQNGEAWYVSPTTEERTYMGRPNDAFSVMREQGVGITNANIAKIEVGEKNLDTSTDTDGDGLSDVIENAFGTDIDNTDTDNDGKSDKAEVLSGYSPVSSTGTYLIDKTFAQKQAGKILLQVEQNGEAWYVNPSDNKRYFLGKPSDAFNIMKGLGLGISDTNLEKITTRASKQIAKTVSEVKAEIKTELTPKQDAKQAPAGEAINNSCQALTSGDACEFTGKDSETVSGTCQTAKDEALVCAGAEMGDAAAQKPVGDQTGTPAGNTQPGADLATAASTLGLTEEALKNALGDPSQGEPDFATAAKTLGITEAALMAALGAPVK